MSYVVDRRHVVADDLFRAHLLQHLDRHIAALPESGLNFFVAVVFHLRGGQLNAAAITLRFFENDQRAPAMHSALLHELLVLAAKIGRKGAKGKAPWLVNADHSAVLYPHPAVGVWTAIIQKEKSGRRCASGTILYWFVKICVDDDGCVQVQMFANVGILNKQVRSEVFLGSIAGLEQYARRPDDPRAHDYFGRAKLHRLPVLNDLDPGRHGPGAFLFDY